MYNINRKKYATPKKSNKHNDSKKYTKIVIKRPSGDKNKNFIDLQKYKKPVKRPEDFMKMINFNKQEFGVTGGKKSNHQTKLKYTQKNSRSKNTKSNQGQLTKGIALTNKYKKQKIESKQKGLNYSKKGYITRPFKKSNKKHMKKRGDISLQPYKIKSDKSNQKNKSYYNPNNTYYKGQHNIQQRPPQRQQQFQSSQLNYSNTKIKMKIKKNRNGGLDHLSFTKPKSQEKQQRSKSQANLNYQGINPYNKKLPNQQKSHSQKRQQGGNSNQYGTQYNFYVVKNKTQIGNMNLKKSSTRSQQKKQSTSDRRRRQEQNLKKQRAQQKSEERKRTNQMKEEAQMISQVIRKITLLGLKKKKNDKVTSQEAYEILYEMNGVFKYLIEKLGSIKNKETSYWVHPFQQIQKGFDTYHIFLHKQNKRLEGEKKVLEREVRNKELSTKTKNLIKQVEKEEALNALLDSVSDTPDGQRKITLPSPLRKRLKLNLNNLPPPKDDEYITFTETVTESENGGGGGSGEDDSLNESQWDQILKDVMEKGYVIDKDGNKQELPPELKQKIQLLQVVERQEEERLQNSRPQSNKKHQASH